MNCEICPGKISEAPCKVLRTGYCVGNEQCAYQCKQCGALHSESGKIFLNEKRQIGRIKDDGKVQLYSLEEAKLPT